MRMAVSSWLYHHGSLGMALRAWLSLGMTFWTPPIHMAPQMWFDGYGAMDMDPRIGPHGTAPSVGTFTTAHVLLFGQKLYRHSHRAIAIGP